MSDKVYDSKKEQLCSSDSNKKNDYMRFEIAHGFNSKTEIEFVHEKIFVIIEAAGKVEFFDSDRNLLATAYEPEGSDGHGRYEDISCKVEDNKIMIRFPQYTWIDHYPHCDGEYDRWDSRIVGWNAPIVFDMTTHEVSTVRK